MKKIRLRTYDSFISAQKVQKRNILKAFHEGKRKQVTYKGSSLSEPNTEDKAHHWKTEEEKCWAKNLTSTQTRTQWEGKARIQRAHRLQTLWKNYSGETATTKEEDVGYEKHWKEKNQQSSSTPYALTTIDA